MKNKVLFYSLLCALGTFVYIGLVGLIISNGNKIFGQADNTLSSISFLLLFVMSAFITGMLMLGGPVWNYLEGNKKTAIKWLFYNLGWLVTITLVSLLGLILL